MFVMKGMYNSLAGIEIPDAPTEDKNIALNPMDAFSADDFATPEAGRTS